MAGTPTHTLTAASALYELHMLYSLEKMAACSTADTMLIPCLLVKQEGVSTVQCFSHQASALAPHHMLEAFILPHAVPNSACRHRPHHLSQPLTWSNLRH
jgi:hypothetical protein